MQAPFTNSSLSSRFIQKLYQPVDNSPLIVFRICFGFLLFYHCIHFILSGKVFENFIQPPFTFTYIGFEFLQPLPGNGMYYYFGFLTFACCAPATGSNNRQIYASINNGYCMNGPISKKISLLCKAIQTET